MMAELFPQPDRLELERTIERQIALRTWGRLQRLRVEVTADRVIVHGFSSSYYVKQLALQGVLDVFQATDCPQVELDVEVGAFQPLARRT